MFGFLFRISNITETNLSEILSKTNDGSNETLLPNVILEKVTRIKIDTVFESFYYDQSAEKSIIIACGSSYLYFHLIGDKTIKIEIPKDFKEIKKIFAAANMM